MNQKNETAILTEHVMVAFELDGQKLSPPAIKAVVSDLAGYAVNDVLAALSLCRKQVKRHCLSIKEIIDRIPTGHPGVEEAWGLVSPALNDEGRTIVWTDQIREAWGVALNLAHDPVAARMAFKEKYTALIDEARSMKLAPVWAVSLGFEKSGRTDAVRIAIAKGYISEAVGLRLLPAPELTDSELKVLELINMKSIE